MFCPSPSLVKNTSYEAPHYAVFSNLPSLHLSPIQIFSSAPCSQTPSVYILPLMSETKFHTYTKLQEKCVVFFLHFSFYDFRKQMRRQKVLS
jgi:hypothetical protein